MTIYNVGVNPSSIAIVTKGLNRGYVTNSNNYGITGSDTVTVLNLDTGIPITTIHHPSFNQPYRIAIDDKCRYAYVCNSGSPTNIGDQGTLSIIDIKSNTVIGTINGFDGPGAIVLKDDKAYVTNYGAPGGLGSGNGTTVSVVDLKLRSITDTITTDLAPSALKLSSNGKYLYVTCYVDGNPGTGTLNIVRTKTNTIVGTVTGLSGPFGIDITTCGRYAYVTNFGSNNFAPYGTTVSVIDLKCRKIVTDIEVGIQPAAILIDGSVAYVTLYNALYAGAKYTDLTFGTGTIVPLCTRTHKIKGPAILAGFGPSGLALHRHRLYVTQYPQNIVESIDTRSYNV